MTQNPSAEPSTFKERDDERLQKLKTIVTTQITPRVRTLMESTNLALSELPPDDATNFDARKRYWLQNLIPDLMQGLKRAFPTHLNERTLNALAIDLDDKIRRVAQRNTDEVFKLMYKMHKKYESTVPGGASIYDFVCEYLPGRRRWVRIVFNESNGTSVGYTQGSTLSDTVAGFMMPADAVKGTGRIKIVRPVDFNEFAEPYIDVFWGSEGTAMVVNAKLSYMKKSFLLFNKPVTEVKTFKFFIPANAVTATAGGMGKRAMWSRTAAKVTLPDHSIRTLYRNPDFPGEKRIRRMVATRGGARRVVYVKPGLP